MRAFKPLAHFLLAVCRERFSRASFCHGHGRVKLHQRFDPRAATVVEYRFFGGLTHDEIASLLGTSEVTIRRSWTSARAWLRAELGPEAMREVSALNADPRARP